METEQEDVLRARLAFLCTALGSAIVSAIAGITVYALSNSLTVEVDFLNSSSDAFSLMVNIFAEYAKSSVSNPRYILSIDLVGGFVSLTMLVGVVFFCLVRAKARSDRPLAPESHVEHMGPILAYNVVTLACGAVTLYVWRRFYSRMGMDNGTSRTDWVNVFSGLLHVAMDFLGGMILVCTSFWLLYLSMKPEDHWLRRDAVNMVRSDAVGSVLLCACVILSALVMVVQSIRSARLLMSDALDPEACDQKKAKLQKSEDSKGAEYGAIAVAG